MSYRICTLELTEQQAKLLLDGFPYIDPDAPSHEDLRQKLLPIRDSLVEFLNPTGGSA